MSKQKRGCYIFQKTTIIVSVMGLVLLGLAIGDVGALQGLPTEKESLLTATILESDLSYPLVDTGQTTCYDNSDLIDCPAEGEAFYGQDAQHDGNQPSYTLSADGLTVYDYVTGLTWMQSPDTNLDGTITYADKLIWTQAQTVPATLNAANYAGYDDWRLPTIKELYSLIDFSGVDPSGWNGDTSSLVPFIDTDYFDFEYGDTNAGERIIDAQYWSSTEYVATTMGGSATTFGVNFADGRIKGYGREHPGGGEMTQFVRYVRGNTDYGVNDFVDNGDPSAGSGQAGTITDNATGLMWAQDDSGTGMNWEEALAWVQQKNAENYLGHDDWRLPNAKELQSIVDYTRSLDTTSSAAIDPLFNVTAITNEAGQTDYPSYWTSTTHANWTNTSGAYGAYVAFGRAMGYMHENWIDVHGAGAQRSDPKSGDPADWPTGHGPQGDAIRIYNYVRLVRDAGQSSLSGDVNGDCVVDIADIMVVASCWHASAGDPSYDARYDLDGSGDIDIADIMQVATQWGETCD